MLLLQKSTFSKKNIFFLHIRVQQFCFFFIMNHLIIEPLLLKGYLLSAAVSPSKKVADQGYDVPSIAKDLDWIAIMAYDYHGHWDKKTGHVAPMFDHPKGAQYLNAVIFKH